MILKSIKLLNIRSYLSEEIDFPEGRVLLSGDIGSGKSTILLAAEFALFGIMKGDLSGESLLRHGKKQGYVELKFELGGKEIEIKRVLKRTTAGVKQDSGYIISDGKKKEGTATELKAAIINMMGYPKELISKSKGLVYRYTVYTPQEAMKHILFEDKEQRLNTLRRVFNIDKYKRIRENAMIYIRELRDQRKELDGFISDIKEKKNYFAENDNKIKKIDEKILKITPIAEQEKTAALELKKRVMESEKEVMELQKLKREFALCEQEIRNKAEQNSENNRQIKIIETQVLEIEKELGKDLGISAAEIRKNAEEKDNAVKFLDDTLLKIARKTSEFESVIKSSEEVKQKVAELDNCPTCMQEVSKEHKERIVKNEDEKTRDAKESAEAYISQEKKTKEELAKVKKEIDELRIRERQAIAMQERAKSITEKKKRAVEIGERQQKIKKEIGAANMKKIKVSEEINTMLNSEESYKKARAEYEKSVENLHRTEMEQNSLIKEKEGIANLLGEIKAELEKKEFAQENLKRIKGVQHWLEEFFVSLTSSIEKQVMGNVYHNFNSIFHDWFKMLIEDETINTRLDDSFTPIIVQNGFETGIENLSGGEKTSCALAYRLALNKVINSIITDIKTKDLIILDEPTDGFSTEQLDKVRDVLDELNMKQVIIVSHEQKIESFVDSVIKIQKNEHMSQIARAF